MDKTGSTLSARLMNRDSARIIIERLSQDGLKSLLRWYLHPSGANGGQVILNVAPIFDALLDALVDSTIHMISEQSSEPGELIMPRHHQPMPNEALGAIFGAGLDLGAYLRDRVEASSPFETYVDMDCAVEEMAAFSLLADSSEESPVHPLDITHKLIQLEPALPLILKALQNMECRGQRSSLRRGAPLRLLFFGGLLASGIQVPEISLPEKSQDAPF